MIRGRQRTLTLAACDLGLQCDQIGRFLKVPGDMVSIKSSQNVW